MSVSFWLCEYQGDKYISGNFEAGEIVNVSNANAMVLFQALGLEEDYSGIIDREHFHNLCVAWLRKHINRPSQPIETTVTREKGYATIIDCGLPEGYINKRIQQLSKGTSPSAADQKYNVVSWG